MAVLGVTVFALAGCGGGGAAWNPMAEAGTGHGAALKGAVTRAEAAKIVDNYVAVNNEANATRNANLLATVEGGQLNAQSTADYRTFATWTKTDQDAYAKPFSYTDRTYYIPAGEGWFAVEARASGSKDPALLVFDREGGAGGWKAMAAVYMDGASVPAIAVGADGLATAVDPSKRVGALAPDEVSAAYEDLFATGGTTTGRSLSLTNSVAKDAIKIYQERDSGTDSAYATKSYAAAKVVRDTVYALRLKDGGAVAVLPTAHTSTYALKPQYEPSFQITPTEEEGVFDPAKRGAVVDTFQGVG
ncbi:hypothetical protein OK074_5653, partial [Actinobacteria bacterium OK074]